jgi:hypothetical protein
LTSILSCRSSTGLTCGSYWFLQNSKKRKSYSSFSFSGFLLQSMQTQTPITAKNVKTECSRSSILLRDSSTCILGGGCVGSETKRREPLQMHFISYNLRPRNLILAKRPVFCYKNRVYVTHVDFNSDILTTTQRSCFYSTYII